MHIFNPTDVVDAVDKDSQMERLAMHVADECTLVAAGVDAIVRIEQFDIDDRRIVAAHLNCKGVGNRFWFLDHLIGVIDADAVYGAVGIELNKRRCLFVVGAAADEENSLIFGFFFISVANSGMGWCVGSRAMQRSFFREND